MTVRIFSVDEASALIPFLEESIRFLQGTARRILEIQDSLSVLELIGASDPKNLEHADFTSRQGELESKAREFRSKVEKIHAHGCLVKDVNTGLVDFYGLKDGRLIFLCWRMGEREIKYWHEVDDGMVGRRPVTEL